MFLYGLLMLKNKFNLNSIVDKAKFKSFELVYAWFTMSLKPVFTITDKTAMTASRRHDVGMTGPMSAASGHIRSRSPSAADASSHGSAATATSSIRPRTKSIIAV